MLALFVFAAIPAVTIAQGLDAAVLAELMREEGRQVPARDPGSSPKGLRAAVSLARRLNSETRISRPRTTISQRPAADVIGSIASCEPAIAARLPREALLNLPPPARG